jgi:hypothetical protein
MDEKNNMPLQVEQRGRFLVYAEQTMTYLDWKSIPKAPRGHVDRLRQIAASSGNNSKSISANLQEGVIKPYSKANEALIILQSALNDLGNRIGIKAGSNVLSNFDQTATSLNTSIAGDKFQTSGLVGSLQSSTSASGLVGSLQSSNSASNLNEFSLDSNATHTHPSLHSSSTLTGIGQGSHSSEVERLRAEVDSLSLAKRKLQVELKKNESMIDEKDKVITVLKQKLARAGVANS